MVVVGVAMAVALSLTALAGQRVPGRPDALPDPTPPAVGSCLQLKAGEWAPVPCSQAHTAEVAAAWSSHNVPAAGAFGACQSSAVRYLGPAGDSRNGPVGQWMTPTPRTAQTLIRGPGVMPFLPRSWQACLVQPIGATVFSSGYTGRLAGVKSIDSVPRELRSCYVARRDTGVVGVSCDAPHRGEVVAMSQLRVPESRAGLVVADPVIGRLLDREPDQLTACRGFTRAATKSDDPTYRGALQMVIHLELMGVQYTVTPNGAAASLTATSTLYQATCALEVVGDRSLTASVTGLGNGPLPLSS